MAKITLIPILQDNYAYLITFPDSTIGVVDPGEATPIIEHLEANNLTLDYIFNTHHHGDHIAGNQSLLERYGAQLYAPDDSRIANTHIILKDSDDITIGDEPVHIFHCPGHTNTGISLYLPHSQAVFTGDTLFLMGCGRLFEGSAADLWKGLEALRALPDETKIYCGHEYTLTNAKFCAQEAPTNERIAQRLKHIETLHSKNIPTIPGTISEEKETNLFFMSQSIEELAQLRTAKDNA